MLGCDCDVVSRFDLGDFIKSGFEGVDFEGVGEGKAFWLNCDFVSVGELIEFECVHLVAPDCLYITTVI